jgi:hypothetical protein
LCQKSVIRSVKRRRCGQHLLHPPGAQLEAFANLRLRECLAVSIGCALGGRTQRGARERARRRRRQRGSASTPQQFAHGIGAREPGVRFDFALRRTESGTRQQMARVVVAECGRRAAAARQSKQSSSAAVAAASRSAIHAGMGRGGGIELMLPEASMQSCHYM